MKRQSSKPKVLQSMRVKRIVKAFIGTIKYQCLIDSGMHIIARDRDLVTFSNKGDLELFTEYRKYYDANKKAILKEETKPYKY